LQESIK